MKENTLIIDQEKNEDKPIIPATFDTMFKAIFGNTNSIDLTKDLICKIDKDFKLEDIVDLKFLNVELESLYITKEKGIKRVD